jgi:anti-anti-sigma regulatory factor
MGWAGRDAPGVRLRVLADRAEIAVVDDVDIATEPMMERLLEQAVGQGAVHIVLSFCRAAFVGGPAVRLALIALDAVAPRGGTVTIRGDRHVRRLFQVTGVAARVQLEDC